MPIGKAQRRVHYDIMVSSTFKDLQEHRRAVMEAVHRAGLFAQAMELDSASPKDVIDSSLTRVDIADAYIGVIGYRYGQVPRCAERNPQTLSITELEYNRAEQRGLPICMFVMSPDHQVPRSAMDVASSEEQDKLERFRVRVSHKHIYAEFDSVDDLMAKAMQSAIELRELLESRSHDPGLSTPITSDADANETSRYKTTRDETSDFEPPQVTSYIRRPTLEKEIEARCQLQPIVSVEGLSGSGKSYVTAFCCKHFQNLRLYSDTLWHEPKSGETLDSLLAKVEQQLGTIAAASPEAKCKTMMREVAKRQALLIIDDFHTVDQSSYGVLLRVASAMGVPARLLLVSRHAVELQRGFSHIETVRVEGFSAAEMRSFLISRGVRLDDATTKRLELVTDGLPLAASLFSTLVKDRKRDARELLAGEMERTARIRMWFSEVTAGFSNEELMLLRAPQP